MIFVSFFNVFSRNAGLTSRKVPRYLNRVEERPEIIRRMNNDVREYPLCREETDTEETAFPE